MRKSYKFDCNKVSYIIDLAVIEFLIVFVITYDVW